MPEDEAAAAAMQESDSEDDVPLAARNNVAASTGADSAADTPYESDDDGGDDDDDDGDDDEDFQADEDDDEGEARPAGGRARRSAAPAPGEQAEDDEDDDSDSDSDDDLPLSKRAPVKTPAKRAAGKKAAPAAKRARTSARDKKTPAKKTRASNSSKSKEKEKKWDTLFHSGVMFPPEYEPHGVKMKYNGVPVDLTPDQEEVATMYASMIETDYMKKPMFLKNFWDGFKPVLGKGHVIKDLAKCDFRPIYDHLMMEREKKKSLSREDKAAIKAQKDKDEAHHKVALVDGREEPVGNFRVEPPGLFRGRGEHPKMGKIKKRIYPRDITINIGKGETVPAHPYPGQKWKEVRHDNTVTWLAFWKDPINPKEYKYVWLAANSTFKADSDLAKYEKARKLKLHVDRIRKSYRKDWESKSIKEQQMGVALYFIDKLALRAGHEKDEDEADTVGCCTLKVENVELEDDRHIKFDFLGKDSIRYENTVEVDPAVHKAVGRFMKKKGDGKTKKPDDQLFDTMDAQDLNNKLKDLMDGLSVKVFRTYNASITLDKLLQTSDVPPRGRPEDIVALKAEYDRANKEVAVLCNHQRAVPKAHEGQMEKLQLKLADMRKEISSLMKDLKLAKAGKPTAADGTYKGKVVQPDQIDRKLTTKKAALQKAETQAAVKEDLKTVALGTSKINYLDPRISISWCKRNEVPLEKIFNKSLITKFNWAMEVEPDFSF